MVLGCSNTFGEQGALQGGGSMQLFAPIVRRDSALLNGAETFLINGKRCDTSFRHYVSYTQSPSQQGVPLIDRSVY